MTSAFERRFIDTAREDPQGFGNAVKSRYGHDAKTVTALLDIAAKLAQPAGGKMSDRDVQTLKAAHPNVDPGFLSNVAREINAAPARLRGAYFIGAITGDTNVIADRMADAGSAYREIDQLATEYQTQAYADEINRRRGGIADAPPAWKPEEGSVRDLIERQVTPRGVREFSEAVERGDERATAIARHSLAHDIEDAGSKLQDDSLSLREHLTAAVDVHEYESLAADQFGATTGSD